MAVFKPGDRARIKWVKNAANVACYGDATGKTCLVVSVPSRHSKMADCDVLIDNFPLSRENGRNDGTFGALFRQLEPITPTPNAEKQGSKRFENFLCLTMKPLSPELLEEKDTVKVLR